MINAIKELVRKVRRWLHRDSGTGRFISKDEFDKRDPKTTQRERLP